MEGERRRKGGERRGKESFVSHSHHTLSLTHTHAAVSVIKSLRQRFSNFSAYSKASGASGCTNKDASGANLMPSPGHSGE